MELTELQETVNSLWDNAVSVRTLSAYETGLRSFQTFLLMNNLAQHMDPLPRVSEDVLCLYIAHCYKNLHLHYTTIKLYLCGIRFAYLQSGVPCPLIEHANSSVRITTLLNAVKRIQGQVKRPKHPIDSTILTKMCEILQTGYLSPYMDCLLHAACVTAFFGFLRCGELTINHHEFDPTTHLCLGDLTFMDNHVQLHLKASKTDPFRHGINIPLFKLNNSSKLCPFTSLQKYVTKRCKLFTLKNAPTDPLFLDESGNALSRATFLFHVKQVLQRLGLDSTRFQGHSFRIGASSSACKARLEDHLIKTLGRWTSDCCRTYIHTPEQVIQNAQSALIAEL